MLAKTFTLLFYLKRRANYSSGELPIYMRVTVDGDRFEVATKRYCDPERWNSVSVRKQGNKELCVINASLIQTCQFKEFGVWCQI